MGFVTPSYLSVRILPGFGLPLPFAVVYRMRSQRIQQNMWLQRLLLHVAESGESLNRPKTLT
jgi:hypothetical protein